jgi:zinc/manganese transport system permease protein
MILQYLQLPFAQHALIAATLVAIISGLIGPFVASRDMAFAVHGTAELSFTGAAAGLLVAGDAVGGALVGSLFVASAIGLLGERPRERNSAIGVILAAGLGLGVLLLSFYHGFATEATNILFGQIFGVSNTDILILSVIAVAILVAIAVIYRPLQFSSIDPEVAIARGVKTRAINFVFVFILALTLAITPAAAARHFTANPRVVSVLAIVFSLVAADGGLLASLAVSQVKASVFISGISFAIYLVARLTRIVLPAARQARVQTK